MSYSPLNNKRESKSRNSEDEEHFLPSDHEGHSSKKASTPISVYMMISFCGGLLFGTCAIMLVYWLTHDFIMRENTICLQHVQKWSPIQAEVDNSYHLVRFNGSLMKENEFRGPAGPETDAAWNSLGINYRSVRVPIDQAAKSGLKPDQVQINSQHGGGFPANVEGLHHLHCLNLLRQALYYNIDYYRSEGKGAFINSEVIIRHHVSHCLDIVRQQLMCTPDTGLLGQVWWDREQPKAFVDFSTEHKCKNFEAIRQWAEERQIEETVPWDFLQPPKEGDTIYAELP